MTEFITDGVNGLPSMPTKSMRSCLRRLLVDPNLRMRLGCAGKDFVGETLRPETQRRMYVDAFLGTGA